MEYINSIAEIEFVYNTGARPVRVLCEDWEHYVCKYATRTPSYALLAEYLAYEFARTWKLPIPDGKLVSIKPHHVSEAAREAAIPNSAFARPLTGLQWLPHAVEVDNVLIAEIRNGLRLANASELIRIGLFDLWIGNEDRNHNNYNLLAQATEDGRMAFMIDHGSCFNTCNVLVGREIYEIGENESLLTSPLVEAIFPYRKSFMECLVHAYSKFHQDVERAWLSLETILDGIPTSWEINLGELKDRMEDSIFGELWLKKTEAVILGM